MNYNENLSDDRSPGRGGAVPVKVNRVFDSCSDRDCISNVPVILDAGELPSDIQLVKCRCVRVADVCMRLEPVPFNRGALISTSPLHSVWSCLRIPMHVTSLG